MEREDILTNIERNFHLSQKEADIGLALLEERAKSLHFDSVEAYVSAYYPKGFSIVDENLSDEEKGFIKYFKKDTQSLIIATKNSDFQTFLRASASTFRRQLSGELKTKCEKAFGVLDGKWTYEKSLQFAIGFEEYVKFRFVGDEREDIYERAEKFTEKMHVRLHINRFETDRIAEIYDSFFTDKNWHFDETKYYQQVDTIRFKNKEELSHEPIFLGMTAPIYQAAGFDRLPCVIDDVSLKQTIDLDSFWYDIKHPDKIFKMPADDTIYIAVTCRDENDIPMITGIYSMGTDGQENFINKIDNYDQLMEIDKALQTNKALSFNPLDEKASSFFRNLYSQGQDTSAFYKNDRLENPSFNAQVAKDAIQTVNAQVSDLLLSYSDIKKLILDYGETNPKDIWQIQEVIFKSNYTDNDVPVSANHIIDVLGKDDFLRLIRRSAFHMSDSRENDDHLIIVDSGDIFEEDYTIHNDRYVTLTEKENFRYTEDIKKNF